MSYDNFTYRELKTECAKRGLGGAGKRVDLLTKLFNEDAGVEPPADLPPPPAAIKVAKPDAGNSNWNSDGTWRRRPKGWTGWE